MSRGLPQAFLDAIVSDMEDDAPRLIYADWLDEQGQGERAEFIRVQVERARRPAWDAAQVGLRLREQELLKLHGENWLAELPSIEGARWEGFRRGIIAEVSFASFEAMRRSAHACRAVAPIEAVTVRWPRRREGRKTVKPIAELRELTLTGTPEYESFEWVAESPQLATLRRLTAGGVWSDLPALLASPHLANLRSLRLPSNGLGNEGFGALAEAATLSALEELDLSSISRHERYNYDEVIRAASIRALVNWPGLATIRLLNLAGNDLNRDGLRALLRSPHVGALKELSLRDGRLDGQVIGEFASALPGLCLETLDLGENVLKDVGAEYVATAPCLRELKTLRLDRCEITLAGARLFAKKAAFLGGLRQLDIGHNHFGPIGLADLLKREPPTLHTLQMRDNDLFELGAKLLANSPASNALLEVDLSLNDLGPAATQALGESAHLDGLLVLRLADNPINELAASTLAASPLGRRLAVLELDNLPPAPSPPPVGRGEIPS
jgi:uncharacterized protein (TIGR02996 family)